MHIAINGDVPEAMEPVGPLTKVAPGGWVEHIERWTLHKNVHIREWTDAELDRVLLPLVKE